MASQLYVGLLHVTRVIVFHFFLFVGLVTVYIPIFILLVFLIIVFLLSESGAFCWGNSVMGHAI